MEVRARLSKEQRRGRLLGAARALFGKNGYRKTEVDDIARQAGVTKPMLYRHFPGGKAEVYVAVLDEHIRVLLETLWEAMSSPDTAVERLHAGLRAYLEFAEKYPEGFRLLADSSPDLDAGVGNRVQHVRDSIATGLAAAIADVMKDAGLSTDGAPVYAHAMLGGVESVITWWLESKQPDREKVVDYLLAFLWRGFDGLPRDPTRFHEEKLP